MKWFASLVLLLVMLDVTACESSAQLFGPKKPKIPPQQRVPELIIALKVEKDAHKRADAAEELRQYDVKEFPEIIPVLIDALQNDTATGVRIEAATSLGRIRPISPQAGQALEKAASGDSNWRVNLQARTSLVYYQLSGYHAPKKSESTGPVLPGRTDEPPLAGASATGSEPWWQNGPGSAKATMPSTPNVYRPLPSGPTLNPQVPVVSMPSPQTDPMPPQGPPLPTLIPNLQTPPPLQWTPVKDVSK
jgi:HEAT repeats